MKPIVKGKICAQPKWSSWSNLSLAKEARIQIIKKRKGTARETPMNKIHTKVDIVYILVYSPRKK